MKKSILITAVLSILLTSCGGSGWSCKKSYCETQKSKVDMTKNEVMCLEEKILVKP